MAGKHHAHQHGGTDVYDDCCQTQEVAVTVRRDDLVNALAFVPVNGHHWYARLRATLEES